MQAKRILLTTFLVPFLVLLYGCDAKESAPQGNSFVTAAQAMPQGGAEKKLPANVVSKEEFSKLAKQIGCFACHSIEKKLLGPAWRHVAGIYRQDPAAEDKLMNKIAKGGGGVWGSIEMPGYPDLSEEKRRVLVKYILALE